MAPLGSGRTPPSRGPIPALREHPEDFLAEEVFGLIAAEFPEEVDGLVYGAGDAVVDGLVDALLSGGLGVVAPDHNAEVLAVDEVLHEGLDSDAVALGEVDAVQGVEGLDDFGELHHVRFAEHTGHDIADAYEGGVLLREAQVALVGELEAEAVEVDVVGDAGGESAVVAARGARRSRAVQPIGRTEDWEYFQGERN